MSGNIQYGVWAGCVEPHLWSFSKLETFIFSLTESNCPIVFTMIIWSCSFEYVKHSVCQWLTEIQSDHLAGVLEGKPTKFKSHLPSIYVQCAFPPPPRSPFPPSFCICLIYLQCMRNCLCGLPQSAISCKLVFFAKVLLSEITHAEKNHLRQNNSSQVR